MKPLTQADFDFAIALTDFNSDELDDGTGLCRQQDSSGQSSQGGASDGAAGGAGSVGGAAPNLAMLRLRPGGRQPSDGEVCKRRHVATVTFASTPTHLTPTSCSSAPLSHCHLFLRLAQARPLLQWQTDAMSALKGSTTDRCRLMRRLAMGRFVCPASSTYSAFPAPQVRACD